IAPQGDFRRLLGGRGLTGHQVDGFMKHVLGGHLLAIFTFTEPEAVGPALSVLERMGALRVAQVDGSLTAEEAARMNSMPDDSKPDDSKPDGSDSMLRAVTGPGPGREDEGVVQGEGSGTP